MFPGLSWQMRHIRFILIIVGYVSRKYHKSIAERLEKCRSNPSHRLMWAKKPDNTGFSQSVDTIYLFDRDFMNYRDFPLNTGKKIRSMILL